MESWSCVCVCVCVCVRGCVCVCVCVCVFRSGCPEIIFWPRVPAQSVESVEMPGPLVAASGDLDAWASFMLVEFTAYDTSHARQGTVLDNLSDNAGTVSFLALSDEHLMPGCRQSEHGPDVDFHTDKFRQQRGA